MPSFTVIGCEKTGEKDSQYGRMKTLQLQLRNADGTEENAEWFTSVNTNEPAPGETIEGETSDSNYGRKFKKPKVGGGGGGGRSPAEQKRIVRQHSQEISVRVFTLLGWKPSADEFKALCNWLDNDVEEASERSTKRHNVEAWPMASDVPGDTAGLEVKQSDGDAFP